MRTYPTVERSTKSYQKHGALRPSLEAANVLFANLVQFSSVQYTFV